MKLQILSSACLGCLLVAQLRADDLPPLKLQLIIDGKSYPIEAHKEARIEGRFDNPTVVVRATRLFSKSGVSFEYPVNFAYHVEDPPRNRSRTVLFGKKCKIIFDTYEEETNSTEYVKQGAATLRKLGAKKAMIQAVTRKIGHETIEGTRLFAVLGPTTVVQDVFAIPSDGNTWRLLILQDVDIERNPADEETKEVLEHLSRTLRWTKSNGDKSVLQP